MQYKPQINTSKTKKQKSEINTTNRVNFYNLKLILSFHPLIFVFFYAGMTHWVKWLKKKTKQNKESSDSGRKNQPACKEKL